MEMTPQRVRSAEFKTVRKGADPDEIRVFLDDVATELERAQNQAAAMEARARAAVARLQEVTEGAPAAPSSVDASVEESETISRTLLLAQRTADNTVAEAQATAAAAISHANDEAARTLDSTREMAAQMLDEARAQARQEGTAERESIAEEVDALKARRDFLESDVHHLETFLVDQRARVREAGTSLIDLADRVPGGLGSVRPPLLSASDDDDADDGVVVESIDEVAEEVADEYEVEELLIVTEAAPIVESADEGARDMDRDPWGSSSSIDDPTESIPVVSGADDGEASSDGDNDEFRFSFDDNRS